SEGTEEPKANVEVDDRPRDTRMWGGRFEEATDALVQRMNASISVDQAMAEDDLRGSMAHARMLAEQGILTPEEGSAILAGLEGLLGELRAGELTFTEELEDIHMNLEKMLTDRIGPVGGKLHTARSRND